jgi:hypothetical protein
MEDADRVREPRMGRAGKDKFRNAELLDTAKALELRRID